jgi:uncharacterized protein involved in exopolysaccharide biosynthesis
MKDDASGRSGPERDRIGPVRALPTNSTDDPQGYGPYGTRSASDLGRPHRTARFVVITVLVLMAMAAAYVASEMRTTVYAASADILFSADPIQPAQQMEREVATQALVLVSRNIVEPVAEARGMSFDDLSESLTVESLRDTNVVRLRFEADDPELARDITGAVVDRYLEHFSAVATPSGETAAALDAEIERLSGELDDISERINELDDLRLQSDNPGTRTAEQVRLEARANILAQRISGLQDRRLTETMERDGRAEPVVIAEPAILADVVAPTRTQSIAAAALAGSLVGGSLLSLAFVLQRRSSMPQPSGDVGSA